MTMAQCHLILTLTLLLVTLASFTQGQSCNGGGEEKKPAPPPPHTNIVLVGATGDLAKKYLWNALFELFKEQHSKKQHFSIYGCARAKPDEGREALSKILLNTIKCTDAACRDMKMKFVGATQYHQLKTEAHYRDLGDKMNENTQSMYGLQDTEFSSETGRIVYLSIPPSAYVQTASWVHKHFRPQYGHPYFRLVLEKPFGRDLTSAQELASSLAKIYDEKEIYRIDHYLGKTTVQYMLPFRQLNKAVYEPIWNKNHIEQVEIVMKEKHDVKDRVAFYDDLGVIRDVMQNHLTELLALVALEVPRDSSHIGTILRAKEAVLRASYGTGGTRALLGQYATYAGEVLNEGLVERRRREGGGGGDSKDKANKATKEKQNPDPNLGTDDTPEISLTPTYGAVLLEVRDPRWTGVPFVLVAGKKLDEKASYVRIVFKSARNRAFCVNDATGDSNCGEEIPSASNSGTISGANSNDAKGNSSSKAESPRQVVFWIGGDRASGDLSPMVMVSKALPKPRENKLWRLYDKEIKLKRDVFGMGIEDMYVLKPEVEEDAYCSLLRAVYEGQRHLFTSTSSLMSSWEFWTPILNQLKHTQPRLYSDDGTQKNWLDFEVIGTQKLQYIHKDPFMDIPEKVESSNIAGLPKKFRDQNLIVRDFEDTLRVLTQFLVATAEESIAERGSFHLGLSGGRSMPDLLIHLTSNYPTFPWMQTHLWQVDERCVDFKDKRSNFNLLERYLLADSNVVIPFMNIHKMPVQFGARICEPEDNGPAIYEEELRFYTTPNGNGVDRTNGTDGQIGTLDLVILGVGTDGHTASLFPNTEALNEYERAVLLTTREEERKSGGGGSGERKTERTTTQHRSKTTDNEHETEIETETVIESETETTETETVTETVDHSTETDPTPTKTQTTLTRMTLTFATLNRARQVAVLVTGEEKHEVVSRLAEAGDDPKALPITGVKADHVTWFMDRAAWFGKR